ncbi:TRAP transporter substrate-binding protein DctP [Paracoccus sp. Z330]|uniref:TRAP transporter substrate-binding protein DctP n=1 Tax=Paracoccus onchidii TaxID=3017813 RepID=A0ABT4ZE68_9RHOB|nr:TRAP transporter substrate-binding protein DctP [Paracoccus onchidii]MDB6177293.1 TRAP transporter substrate-binding protein DctP [Paracoccus onchidii]
MTRFYTASILAMAIGLGGSAAALAQDFTMRIAHAGPATMENDDYVGSTSLKEYIEGHSDGRVAVEIYPGNQLGSYEEVMEQVNVNALEVAHVSIGGVTPFVPELAVVDLQYILPNDEVAYKFMEGGFTQDMTQAVLDKLPNTRLVAVSDGGRWRSFFTTSEVKTADDLSGMKIRTISSPLQQEFVRSLGAAPTPVAWGELYTALSTGVVDGTKNGTPDIMSNKFNEVVTNVILDRHTFLFGYYFVSDQWLQELPEDLQQVVLDGFEHAASEQTKFNAETEAAANEAFEAAGGAIYTPTEDDRETFLGARQAMQDWYVGKYGDEWLNKMLAAVEEAKAAAGQE